MARTVQWIHGTGRLIPTRTQLDLRIEMFTWLCRSPWFSTTAAISACTQATHTWQAKVFATSLGSTTLATVFAEPQKVRVEVGDHIPHVVVVRYDLRLLYLQIPTMATYLELPLSALGNAAFGEPILKVDRTSREETEVQGVPAVRYGTTVYDGTGRTYEGWLWESRTDSCCPILWKDSAGESVTAWKEVKESSLSAKLFDIPKGYLRM